MTVFEDGGRCAVGEWFFLVRMPTRHPGGPWVWWERPSQEVGGPLPPTLPLSHPVSSAEPPALFLKWVPAGKGRSKPSGWDKFQPKRLCEQSKCDHCCRKMPQDMLYSVALQGRGARGPEGQAERVGTLLMAQKLWHLSGFTNKVIRIRWCHFLFVYS